MLPPWRNASFAALQHRNFRHYTWGQIVNLAGTRIHEVAAGWLMWQLTGSAAWVGALAFVEMAPRLIMWPIAGTMADRVDRRKLAVISQTISALIALSLAVLSGFGLIGVYGLLAFTILFGVNSAFWQPIRLAIIPRLVPRDTVASAIGLSSVVANLARVLGPMLAGPVLLWGSVTLAFALNSVSFIAAVTAFWLMDLPTNQTFENGKRRAISARDFSMGISTILGDPGIRVLLAYVAGIAICVRPVTELLPVFAEAVLDSGPAGLAALTSALGFGSVFSGIVASGNRQRTGQVTLLAVAGAIGSLMIAIFAFISDLRFAIACVAVMGFGITLTNIIGQILLQLTVKDEVRGRVLSIYGMLFSSAPGLGALAMGWAGDRVGIAIPVVCGAAIGLAASAAVFVNRLKLVRLLEPPPERAGWGRIGPD